MGDGAGRANGRLRCVCVPRALRPVRTAGLLAGAAGTEYAAFAEEIVQEVFLAVWRQPALFQPGKGQFVSWLLAAAHHKAIDVVGREEPAPPPRRRATSGGRSR